jgi:hypothetical protein
MLSRHKSSVVCVAIDETANLLVSCARNGSIVTAALRDGTYLKMLMGPEDPRKVSISKSGRVYVQYETSIFGYDRNLNEYGHHMFDAPVTCFTVIEDVSGQDWLFVSLKSRVLMIVGCPGFEVLWNPGRFEFEVVQMKRCGMEVIVGTSEGEICVFGFDN